MNSTVSPSRPARRPSAAACSVRLPAPALRCVQPKADGDNAAVHTQWSGMRTCHKMLGRTRSSLRRPSDRPPAKRKRARRPPCTCLHCNAAGRRLHDLIRPSPRCARRRDVMRQKSSRSKTHTEPLRPQHSHTNVAAASGAGAAFAGSDVVIYDVRTTNAHSSAARAGARHGTWRAARCRAAGSRPRGRGLDNCLLRDSRQPDGAHGRSVRGAARGAIGAGPLIRRSVQSEPQNSRKG